MKRFLIALGVVFVGVASFAVTTAYRHHKRAEAYDVRNCQTPVLHFGNANIDVCLEPGISNVTLTFDRPVAVHKFVWALTRIKGIDLDTSRMDDRGKLFRIVYYMSRTNDAEFINNLMAAIDNPALYKRQ